jgi:16S rRNA (guanine527-N7)-methyltransferase
VKLGVFRRRLGDRIAPLSVALSTPQVDQLETYFELLAHWNRRINLTALPLEPLGDETLDRLIIEPIAAARHVRSSPLTWFDLGSGGGSPAVPLRILRPVTRLTMVEARAKKAAFLREVARELNLTNVTVVNKRLEEWTPTPHSAQLVTARALRIDVGLLSLVHQFMSPDGHLFLFGADHPMRFLTDTFRETKKVELLPGFPSLTICTP